MCTTGQMLSMATNAVGDGRGGGGLDGEVHCASPEDKLAAVALEKKGLVTIRRTTVQFAGFNEWWVRLAAVGVVRAGAGVVKRGRQSRRGAA